MYCLIYVEIPRIVKTAGYTTGSATLSKLVTQLPGVLVALAVADRTLVHAGQVVGEVTSERFTQGRSLDAAQAQLTERKLGLIGPMFTISHDPSPTYAEYVSDGVSGIALHLHSHSRVHLGALIHTHQQHRLPSL